MNNDAFVWIKLHTEVAKKKKSLNIIWKCILTAMASGYSPESNVSGWTLAPNIWLMMPNGKSFKWSHILLYIEINNQRQYGKQVSGF